MKTRYLGLVVCLTSAPPALAAELRPLSEVIAQESSATTAVYVATRCAGFYSAFAYRAAQSGRTDVQTVVERANNASGQFVAMAATLAKNAGLNQDLAYLMNQSVQIAALYQAEMSANFLVEGNAIGERIAADGEVCGAFLSAR